MILWTAGQTEPDRWLDRCRRAMHPAMEHRRDLLPSSLTALGARQAANLLRCQRLLEHGGLWLDDDVVPLCDLSTSPHCDEPWVAECAGRLEGCAMWFPAPGHRFLQLLQPLVEAQPQRLLATHLHHARQMEPMRGEVRVLPIDAHGRRTGVTEPWAVHLWSTSSRTLARVPWPDG